MGEDRGGELELVGVDCFDLNAVEGQRQLSLFVAAHILQPDEGRQPLLDQWFSTRTAGFADSWQEKLSGRPLRFAKIDDATIDQFLAFSSHDQDQIAMVEVRERYAYDLRYKSGLDVSGIATAVDWHPSAITLIEEFLEPYRRPFLGGRQVDCIIRLPLKWAFTFPEPRGAAKPYEGFLKNSVSLAEIAKFPVDWAEIGIRSDLFDNRVEWDTTPLKGILTSQTILRLSL